MHKLREILNEALKRSAEYDKWYEDSNRVGKDRVQVSYTNLTHAKGASDWRDVDAYKKSRRSLLGRVKRRIDTWKKDKNQPYNIDFTVNDRSNRRDSEYNSETGRWEYNKKNSSYREAKKVLQTVGDSVDNFIRKKKPASILMDGNTETKRKIYKRFAHHIAKKYNGRVESDEDGTHVVHFGGK